MYFQQKNRLHLGRTFAYLLLKIIKIGSKLSSKTNAHILGYNEFALLTIYVTYRRNK